MNPISLGIDIALHSFVAALPLDQKRTIKAEFPNRAAGFRRLQTWLAQHFAGKPRVGIEATNTYADALARWLYEHGYEVYLLNPERVAHYARSQGQRNKTDPADAAMIARFVAQYEGTPWRPPPPEQKTLQELTRARHQLISARLQLANQLKSAGPAARPFLAPVLAKICEQIAGLNRQITAHIKAHPNLAEQVHRLVTLKGIGLVTAAVVVAELPPITADSDPRSICAWAGLAPQRRQSGSTEGRTHIARKGNTYLRQALYMPALVAKRYNPILSAFGQRLKQKGKTNGAILGAIAHKMLRILVGMLKSKTDFNPNWSAELS